MDLTKHGFQWNQGTVRECLEPFSAVARGVKHNRRKVYVGAGGKSRRRRDDPDREWIDSYSGIKTNALNAVFVCYVKLRGDDPRFELQVDGKTEHFKIEDLGRALARWKELAELAVA